MSTQQPKLADKEGHFACGCELHYSAGTFRGIWYCRLHRAAPDLLAALKQMLAGLERMSNVEVSIEFAEAVIEAKALVAKAEEGSNEAP